MIDALGSLVRATPWSVLLCVAIAGLLLGLGGMFAIRDRHASPIAYWCARFNVGVNLITIALSVSGLLRL